MNGNYHMDVPKLGCHHNMKPKYRPPTTIVLSTRNFQKRDTEVRKIGHTCHEPIDLFSFQASWKGSMNPEAQL